MNNQKLFADILILKIFQSTLLEKIRCLYKPQYIPVIFLGLFINNVQACPAGQGCYGVNLSYFNYFSPSVPFKDLIIQSGGGGVYKNWTNTPCPEQPEFDVEGFALSIPKGCMYKIATTFHIPSESFWPEGVNPYKSGKYVLLYKGNGKIKLGWDAKRIRYVKRNRVEFEVPVPKAGISVAVLATDPKDPVRSMHIVHVDDEASFRTQPFNETWLNLLKPFNVIRFTDWGRINEQNLIYSGTVVSHTQDIVTLDEKGKGIISEGDKVAKFHINNKWPRVFVDAFDGNGNIYLKTPIDNSRNINEPQIYLQEFKNTVWKNRTRPVYTKQGTNKGVAFEYMIQLANQLNVDPWISIPTAATDNYVEQLAKLIKKELKPSLKCYIEYSNETWNTSFPGYDYSEAKSKELNLTGTSPRADAWQAYRAVEIFRIFNRVFGEPDLKDDRQQSRLIRILTSQTVWLDRSLRVMDWKMPGNGWPTEGIPAYRYADAWAITTYLHLNDLSQLEQATESQLIQFQKNEIQRLFGTASNPGIIRKQLLEANKRGLQLVTYEGGTHLLAPRNRPDLIAKLANMNKSPQMQGVYTLLMQKWDELRQTYGADKVGVWNHYNDVSRYGKYGYWGLLQSTYQNPDSAPKYKAVRDYIVQGK